MRAARRPGRSAADARAFAARDSRRTRSSRMRATAVVAPRFAFEASESGAARARGGTPPRFIAARETWGAFSSCRPSAREATRAAALRSARIGGYAKTRSGCPASPLASARRARVCDGPVPRRRRQLRSYRTHVS